jgi:DNA polymerase (family 10)
MAGSLHDNDAIAAAFKEASALLELTGEDEGRVRSYDATSRKIEALPRPAGEMIADGSLIEVKGFGPATVGRVKELVETGTMGMLEELRAKVPAGVVECLRVPGLGPKRMRRVWQDLGVASVAELEYACLENRLRDLEGFGPKSQEGVLKGIGFLKRSAGRRLLSQARGAAERTLNRLQREPAALRLAVSGETRRMQPTVAGLELLATAHDAGELLGAFQAMPFVAAAGARTEAAASAVLDDGTPVAIEVVEEAAFVPALLRRSSSKEHWAALERAAAGKGLRLADDGLWRGAERVELAFEDDLYRALDLAPFPPELRDGGDLSLAPPDDLVAIADVQGILHAHTRWSDGSYSVAEMAERAARSGFRWIAICDHSRTAVYANGLTIERVLAQRAEIDALNASGTCPIPVLHGTESDILPDGSLDYPDDVLARFDVVVGSVHAAFTQPAAVMTERLVRAVSSRFLHVLGHPTGRLLLGREGYDFDLERVLDACAAAGTAVELNANPHRLDLDAGLLGGVTRRGIRIAIDPDAHDLLGIEDVLYGVGAARRGRVRRGEVLTALSVEDFRAWCAKKSGLPPPAPLAWKPPPAPEPGDDEEGA